MALPVTHIPASALPLTQSGPANARATTAQAVDVTSHVAHDLELFCEGICLMKSSDRGIAGTYERAYLPVALPAVAYPLLVGYRAVSKVGDVAYATFGPIIAATKEGYLKLVASNTEQKKDVALKLAERMEEILQDLDPALALFYKFNLKELTRLSLIKIAFNSRDLEGGNIRLGTTIFLIEDFILQERCYREDFIALCDAKDWLTNLDLRAPDIPHSWEALMNLLLAYAKGEKMDNTTKNTLMNFMNTVDWINERMSKYPTVKEQWLLMI